MIDVALSILALIAGGLTLELFGAGFPSLGLKEAQSLSLPSLGGELEEFEAGNPS